VVPSIQYGNKINHTIGLGAMGLHTFFAKNQMEYGSPESIEFTDIYFMLLNYWTLMESHQIAKEKQETFHNFEKSAYADGSYFESYINEDYTPTFEKVAELFKGIHIPSKADWEALAQAVKEDGLY